MMQKTFGDKVIVVAGGTGELGGPVTDGFARAGARVVVPFISELRLSAYLANYPELAESVRFERVDLANFKQTRQFIDRVNQREGGPDILVNLTGGFLGGLSVTDTEPGQLAALLNRNVHPVFHLAKCVVPHMARRGGGKIVNVGARAGMRGSAGLSAYSIAKSAVIRLTESLAEEVKAQRINVNCVLPSVIDTRDNRRDMPEADTSLWVTTEEVAEVIFFLASERARALHGAAIPVYGLG